MTIANSWIGKPISNNTVYILPNMAMIHQTIYAINDFSLLFEREEDDDHDDPDPDDPDDFDEDDEE